MGIFYYVRSVALVEDLPLEEENFTTAEKFYADADRGYSQVISLFINTAPYSFFNHFILFFRMPLIVG